MKRKWIAVEQIIRVLKEHETGAKVEEHRSTMATVDEFREIVQKFAMKQNNNLG